MEKIDSKRTYDVSRGKFRGCQPGRGHSGILEYRKIAESAFLTRGGSVGK